MSDSQEKFSFRIIDLKNNPDPAFQTVIDYWNDKRGDNFAPPWTLIDLIDFPPTTLPNCIVVDIKQPITDTSYRYYGSHIAELHGFELTNRTINEIQPLPLRNHIIKQYEHVCQMRMPVIFATQFTGKSGQLLHHLMLRMPLSDDGKNVTNIVTLEVFDNYSNDLQEIYAAMPQA
jgi:hypothetical protein